MARLGLPVASCLWAKCRSAGEGQLGAMLACTSQVASVRFVSIVNRISSYHECVCPLEKIERHASTLLLHAYDHMVVSAIVTCKH